MAALWYRAYPSILWDIGGHQALSAPPLGLNSLRAWVTVITRRAGQMKGISCSIRSAEVRCGGDVMM